MYIYIYIHSLGVALKKPSFNKDLEFASLVRVYRERDGEGERGGGGKREEKKSV